jgi:drug/metabolite transporter (DMT)-like permease
MKLSKGFIITFGAASCWAVLILLTKLIIRNGESSYNIVFWEAIISLPFWLFLFFRQREELRKITPKDYQLLIVIGLISTLFISLIEVLALKYTQAINYSFLIRSTMLFTIFFAYLFLGEKISHKKVIIAILILIGIYFISTNGQLIKFSRGDLLTILEAALISFGNTILGKIATKRMSPALSASGSFLAGVLPVVILGFTLYSVTLPKNLFLILLLAVVTIIGVNIRFTAYRHASASYIAMIYCFTPVIVTFAAVPFFHEKLGVFQIVGGILVILAGIFTEKLKLN